MDLVFSGGIAFEYFQEANDYGPVSVVNPTSVTTVSGAFDSFSSQIHAATPTPVNANDYTSHAVPQLCPAIDDNWKVAPNRLPPTPNEALCDCMMRALTCTANSTDISGQSIKRQFA